MTVANTDVKTTYDGDNATVNFPITADIKEKNVVKVYLLDELTLDASTPSGLAETEQFETGDFTFDVLPIPTLVQMIIAPTGDQKLRVERVSLITQPDVLPAGTDANQTIEDRLDRNIHVLQEIDARLDEVEVIVDVPAISSPSGAIAPIWVAGTVYNINELVVNINTLYRAISTHTADLADFDIDLSGGKWQILSGRVGAKGPQGDTGTAGPSGLNGSNGGVGPTGPAGINGIITALASSGEAIAGTNNTKGMTPLRTAEAIAAQIDEAGIVSNTNSNSTQDIQISDLTSRIIILESLIQQSTGKFAGQQVLLDNQAAPVDLIGLANGGVDDKGAGFSRQSSGTEFAEVLVYFRRKTDTEDRFASTSIVMQFAAGSWLIGRKGTEQLDETLDLDGVTLSINAVSGQVSYISDDMAGANHDTQSIIAWLGQEISKC